MVSVAFVGEHPNDVSCIQSLLLKKYPLGVSFSALLKDVNGSALDNPKIIHLLRKEYQYSKPDVVLFIRDLDALEYDRIQWEKRKQYFVKCNKVVDKKGIYLLNIFELEALLIADKLALEKYFNAPVVVEDDCMLIPSPKEELMKMFRKYNTVMNAVLFPLLNYETVIKNCRYFKKFDTVFNARLITLLNKL
jgi:hypothetical protein